MVVFTCNNCGETLQKPRVAKHYQFQCRSAVFLTCVDCFKDFRGDEYVAHTKCITEAERYGGKDYLPKAGANKGERKQQEWINIVNNLLDGTTNLTNAERGFLTSLSKFDNIPRKKAKFLNFIRSAMGNRTNMAVVESVWGKMETAYKSNAQTPTQTQQQNGKPTEANGIEQASESEVGSKKNDENNIAENQNNENICKERQSEDKKNKTDTNSINNDIEKSPKAIKEKKGKKRSASESVEDQSEEAASKKKSKNTSVLLESSINQCEDLPEKFDWKNTILNVVQTKGEVSLKKLQKKVISQYMNHGSTTVTPEKAVSKFNKKLKKVTEIIISEDKVKLA